MSIEAVLIPRTLGEALARVAEGGIPLAGGTDLVVRASHGLVHGSLVSLHALEELRAVSLAQTGLRIGACVTLAELSESNLCPEWLKAACADVASPLVRGRATLGGALLQDRRCRFHNRPARWRTAVGPCLRTGGPRCLAGGDDCVAQQRSLLGTVLCAVGAVLEVLSLDGERHVPLADVSHHERLPLPPGALLVSIHLPVEGVRVVFRSLRRRASIDYHDVVVAGARTQGGGALALGAVLPYPRRITLRGAPLEPGVVADLVARIPEARPGRLSPGEARRASMVLATRVVRELWP